MAGREKRQLGEVFGLRNFGVNLTRLAPGSVTALRHSHSRQDEFIYNLEGPPMLPTAAGDTQHDPRLCAGYRAETGFALLLLIQTSETVVYLEVGDRTPGDQACYPDVVIQAELMDGSW